MTNSLPNNGQIPPYYAIALTVLLAAIGRQDPNTLTALAAATGTVLPHVKWPKPDA